MFLSSLVFGGLLVFFLVYQPMKTELEKSLMDNFEQISVAKYHSFQNTLLRAEEGQKSLSSRTMIKIAMVDYRSGKISMEDLRSYTQPKFADGAGVLENLIYAQRQVDEVAIAQFTNPMLTEEEESLLSETEGRIQFSTNVKLNLFQGKILGAIKSPIKEGSEVLGYDVLLYDFSRPLRLLSSENVEVGILDLESYQNLLSQSESMVNEGELIKIKKSGQLFITAPLGDGNYFVSEQEMNSLFQPIHRLAIRIAIGGSLTFLIYALTIYLFLVRFTKKELTGLEYSRNRLKEIVYKDQLTGAFTRNFLNIWNQTLRSEASYALVMIDIDDFKKINDQNGHLAGDRVLHTVGQIFLRSIRKEDYLVRYGGDEFVLILMDRDVETAHTLLKNIQGQLAEPQTNKIPIHLSFGIGILNKGDKLEDQLRVADKNMYINKCRNIRIR